MKKHLFLIALLVYLLFPSCKKDEKKKDSMADMVETVAVASPEVKTVILTQSFPGTLQAKDEIDLMARVDGIFHSHVGSGVKVKKGQLLYTIDDGRYRDAVLQAEASLKTAQANHDYYDKQYAAMQKAFKSDAVSELELLESKNNLDQSKASIENAKAALATAKTNLGYCRITAPFDGTVALQIFDDNALINGEGSPVKLNSIYNDDVVFAYISVDEARYAQMMASRANQGLKMDSVKINFNVPLQHEYYSTIDYSAPDVSTSTGTVTMRFSIANKYGELKAGMYCMVELPYAIADNALIIRDASIGTDQQGKYVYLVNDSNKVVYTPVQVGELYRDTLRIITKGISPESRYVTEALLKVRDGMKVKIKD